MATGKTADARRRSTSAPRPCRRWRTALAVLGLVALGLSVWFHREIGGQARLAVAHGARIGCSCHFVAGRPLDRCRADLLPGAFLVTLSADEEEKSVTARWLLLVRETARWRAGEGCALDPWRRQPG